MITENQTKLQQVREQLLAHPMYASVNTPDKVRLFMRYHVFAVWDFMSLLKRIQQLATCSTVPWFPSKPALFARFVNDIMLGEESDEDGKDGFISHFELYVEAMKEVGADAQPISGMVNRLREGQTWEQAIEADDIPAFVREFVTDTMKVVFEGKEHEVAAAFFFGREHIIPHMFGSLVEELEHEELQDSRLLYYLNRHVELDNDRHGPMAEKLLHHLCAENPNFHEEAENVAIRCLESRIRLWDGILQEINSL